MVGEPRVYLLVLGAEQLIGHLLLDGLNLLSKGEVIVEFGLHLALARELSEEKIKKIDQAIESVTDLDDPIVAEIAHILLSLPPKYLLHCELFITNHLQLILRKLLRRHDEILRRSSFMVLAALPRYHVINLNRRAQISILTRRSIQLADVNTVTVVFDF